jgi:poly-gamma-glutamate capsule biosynthesis protein CapA/YwtB (metallophosphatase superfamily)
MCVAIRLFLCGDVMIGRGIDQVLAQSVDPRLFEAWVDDAETYVRLAVRANGPIPRPVPPTYPWGDALEDIDRLRPDVRIVNLETAVTSSDAAWPAKDVLYRTHPGNVAVLAAAQVDCAVLANNHVLDWGSAGLLETLASLSNAGIATVGAGEDRAGAQAPAIMDVPGGRVIVLAFASTNSGVPAEWASAVDRPGVDLIDGWSRAIAAAVADRLKPIERRGDIVVASIHWGSNWGYEVPPEQRRLAHDLIDVGGVDLVYGHSSHHPRPIELYRDRLILYGCGDLITDYEGIAGHEEFRGDLVLAYFPSIDAATGRLEQLIAIPYQLRRFRLARAPVRDAAWVRETLNRHCRPFGTRLDLEPDGAFRMTAVTVR